MIDFLLYKLMIVRRMSSYEPLFKIYKRKAPVKQPTQNVEIGESQEIPWQKTSGTVNLAGSDWLTPLLRQRAHICIGAGSGAARNWPRGRLGDLGLRKPSTLAVNSSQTTVKSPPGNAMLLDVCRYRVSRARAINTAGICKFK